MYNRGLVKSRLDDIDSAILDYRAALEELSEQEYIYQANFNMGICLRRKGQLEESIKYLKKATEQKPQASAFNNLGLSYFE